MELAAQIGAFCAVVFVAVLGFLLDRKDKKEAAKREVKTIPDNHNDLSVFNEWVLQQKQRADNDI